MKIRWFILLAIAATVLLTIPLDYVDADDDDDSDDGEGDNPNEFEIDGISYWINAEDPDTVRANQCFSEEKDIVIPPYVTNEGVTYKVVKITSNFICYEPETISIPYTVTEIEESTFICSTLREINVDEDNLVYSSADGILYDKGKSLMIKCPSAAEIETFIVPVTVTGFDVNCFRDCQSLISIWIPNTIYMIPKGAFEGCTSLARINDDRLPDSVRMIGRSAFEGCTSLEKLDMPENLVYIEEEAFKGSGLKSFSINLFLGYIGVGAFSYCNNLERFNDSNSSYINIGGVLFVNKDNDLVLHTYPCGREGDIYTIPDNTTGLMNSSFTGTNHLKELELSPSVSVITNGAFVNCKSLEKITIPGNIYMIGSSAFYGCNNLKELEIKEGVIKIDSFAFAYCGMENVTIPTTVKYIEDNVFTDCTSLKTVDINSPTLDIGGNAFAYCTSITEINFYGTEVTFDRCTFEMMENEEQAIVSITKDVTLPDNLSDFNSDYKIVVFGERPYPWENLIGVFFCALVILLLLRFMRF